MVAWGIEKKTVKDSEQIIIMNMGPSITKIIVSNCYSTYIEMSPENKISSPSKGKCNKAMQW